ncbi:hypothetical protein [Rahnella sp. RcJ3]|uniref:hypothetical protein n=1 Tax=Rahnella sp. RcJ3 TaxID=2292446 RepID=UPI001295356F|nr:hypothetical protein [Rahnella sp. RcJ3]MQB53665.1 hypothetical protein [Rahnella sp. RcJ3]
MRSLKISSAVIYFMAKGEKLPRAQVFGNRGNPVYAIWTKGRLWEVSCKNGEFWESVEEIPFSNVRETFETALNNYLSRY